MPNWVSNELKITGEQDDIDYIKERLNSPFSTMHDRYDDSTGKWGKKEVLYSRPVFAFWNIVKPGNLEAYHSSGDDATTANPLNWYSWNNSNWGTKWDVAVSDDNKYPSTQLFEEEGKLVYIFDTAWAPPINAIEQLVALIPNCTITLYYQEETGWGGKLVYEDGEVIDSSEYNWKCFECKYEELGEPPYCEECEYDMCPSCGYGEPMDEDKDNCSVHGKMSELSRTSVN